MTQREGESQLSPNGLVVQLEETARQIGALAASMHEELDPGEAAESDGTESTAAGSDRLMGLLADLRQQVEHAHDQLRQLEAAQGCASPPPPARRPRVQVPARGLRGSTRFISLPELITMLTSQHKTGTLHIKHGDQRFVLEFVGGSIVHAAANSALPDERLGDILVKSGAITGSALEEFADAHDPTQGPIGAALASAGLIDGEQLHDALSEQVRKLFRRVFALADALFYFADDQMRELEYRVRLNTTRLLLESARQQDEVGRGVT